jgi:hypothetical protein
MDERRMRMGEHDGYRFRLRSVRSGGRREFVHLAPLAAIECTHLKGRRPTGWKTRIFSTLRLAAAPSAFNVEGHLSD